MSLSYSDWNDRIFLWKKVMLKQEEHLSSIKPLLFFQTSMDTWQSLSNHTQTQILSIPSTIILMYTCPHSTSVYSQISCLLLLSTHIHVINDQILPRHTNSTQTQIHFHFQTHSLHTYTQGRKAHYSRSVNIAFGCRRMDGGRWGYRGGLPAIRLISLINGVNWASLS